MDGQELDALKIWEKKNNNNQKTFEIYYFYNHNANYNKENTEDFQKL